MSKKFKVFVTRRIPDAGLDMLKKQKDIQLKVFPHDRRITRKELLDNVKGVDALLPLLTERVDSKLLDAAGPRLKVVANLAVGYDNIDVKACETRGVIVANTPGVLTDAVAEHTFALMMSIMRRIPESDRYTRAGKYKAWEPMLLLGSQVKRKTLGIIGLGRIGAGVAERAVKGMGMHVLYSDISRNPAFEKEFGAKYATIDSICRRADVVTLHVPLLPSTHHLMDAKRLKLMKRNAYLINTSRGPIVDEAALAKTLKRNGIAGAALDVFEFEPKVTPELKKLDNVILTPHTASATIEARSAMATLAAGAIIKVLRGKTPKNIVKSR